MATKSTALLARGKRVKKSVKYIPDHKIDFSDIPELTDKELKQMKSVGRPLLGSSARQIIAIRIDPDTLSQIKNQAEIDGKGYQTLINEILNQYIRKAG